MRPEISTYPPYFNTYIKLIEGDDIKKIIPELSASQLQFFESISEVQSVYKYADEKWTVKEVLQHVIDAERIFCYRTLALARGEKNILPGFDENDYARNSHANDRNWSDLIEEFKAVRNATGHFIKSLNDSDLKKSGSVLDYRISVHALLYVIAGHSQHHINIIRQRYLDL
ncbi:MAG: DinB family protein [Chitinophagaceae bacterium]|nr:DinB family protein [Chitinophagaceae bacterium]